MVIGIDASRAFGEGRTGTENYAYHLITHMLRLPESSKDDFVLFVRPNATIPVEVKQDNVKIVEINFRYLWTQLGLALATWQKFEQKQGDLVQKKNLDVLWVPAHTLPLLRQPKTKTVVTIHGLEYEWLPEYKNMLQKWYLPLSTIYAAKYADKIIAVSHFTKKQLVKRLKTTSKKIKVIYEGVKSNEAAVRQKKLDPFYYRVLNKWKLKNKQYLLFVGTIQPRKNLAFLIEVFAKLPKSLRQQLKLVIAGSKGWMTEEADYAPAKYGVSREVVFTGRVGEEELEVLYTGALIYVQPSITEGFGLPILEAMAHRVPVVSSNGGALPEVVGEAGLILPVNDEAKWIDGLTKLISNPRWRERLAAAGVWRVRQFGWAKAAAETLKLLQKIV